MAAPLTCVTCLLPTRRRTGSRRLAPTLVTIAALVGANVIWGGSPAASKAALDTLGPFTVGAGRAGIALLVMALVLALRHERPARGQAPALLGLCGVALFCAFQNLGLYFADATTTAMIGGARPVLIAVIAVPLLGEYLGRTRVMGLMVSMIGIFAIALVGTGASPAASLGALLPLGSAAAIAVYAVLSRRVGNGGSLAMIAGATRYGFLLLLPGAMVEFATGGVPSPTAHNMLVMLYLGVGCSAISFVLLGYALARIDVGRAAAFFTIQVVAGVALSVTVLGESLTLARLGGGLMVLGGVALAARQPAAPRAT